MRLTFAVASGLLFPRRFAALVLAASLLGGCAYPNRGHRLERVGASLGFGPDTAAFDSPRLRLGAMPFDAWYSPWEALDADALGQHRHEGGGVIALPWGSPRSAEVSRGILYTEAGGFLDIAHLRNAIDLTRFVHAQVAPKIAIGRPTTLRLLAAEPDLYHLRLDPPPGATPAERAEAAVQIAGRVAYLMTTWHEVLTWYGYRGMGVITEQPSAFSYDDAASHRVGVELAMEVLREVAPDPRGPRKPGAEEIDTAVFDAAVTAALPRVLHGLGAVPPEEATERMRSLEGSWWADGRPLLRVIDLGLDGTPLPAHLAPPPEASQPPEALRQPSAARRFGRSGPAGLELRRPSGARRRPAVGLVRRLHRTRELRGR